MTGAAYQPGPELFIAVFGLAVIGWWALGAFIDRLCDLAERAWARYRRQDDRLAAEDFANADWERTGGAVGWPAADVRTQDERVRQAVLEGYRRRRENAARLHNGNGPEG